MPDVNFNLWAPNPQPVDYSPMMQASAARMHALTQLGSDIGKGIEEASAKAERNRRESETEQAIKSLADESITESFTRMPAEVLYPDFMEHIQSPVARKMGITEELMKRGLSQENAVAQAEEYLTPRTYRYYNEAGRQRIAAVMAKGVSRGTFTPQQFHEILASGNIHEDLQSALQAQTTAWKAPELDQREAALFQSQIRKQEMSYATSEQQKIDESRANRRLVDVPIEMDFQLASTEKLADYKAQLDDRYESARADNNYEKEIASIKLKQEFEQAMQARELRSREGIATMGAQVDLDVASMKAKASQREKLSPAQKIDLRELISIRNSADVGEAKPAKDVTLLNALSGEDYNALVAKVSDKFGVLPGAFPDATQFQDIHVRAAPGNKVEVTMGPGSAGDANVVKQLLVGAFGSEALASRAIAVQQFAPLNSPRGSAFRALLDRLRSAPRKSPRILNVFEDLYQAATAGEAVGAGAAGRGMPGAGLYKE